MRRLTHDRWFYKQEGRIHGPVSTATLRELLASGQLISSQPVWATNDCGLVFVRAEAAIGQGAPERELQVC
jgi:hypothetical protein